MAPGVAERGRAVVPSEGRRHRDGPPLGSGAGGPVTPRLYRPLSLRARLAAGALPQRKALEIAVQMARILRGCLEQLDKAGLRLSLIAVSPDAKYCVHSYSRLPSDL